MQFPPVENLVEKYGFSYLKNRPSGRPVLPAPRRCPPLRNHPCRRRRSGNRGKQKLAFLGAGFDVAYGFGSPPLISISAMLRICSTGSNPERSKAITNSYFAIWPCTNILASLRSRVFRDRWIIGPPKMSLKASRSFGTRSEVIHAVFALLKVRHGHHRLPSLSPFNTSLTLEWSVLV